VAGYTTVVRVFGGPGAKLELEPSEGKLHMTLIDGRRVLEAGFDASDVFEALFNIVTDEPKLLMRRVEHTCGPYGCSYTYLPNMGLLAHILLALRSVLSAAPRAFEAEDDDGHRYWVWSPEEEMAARKAAILLDIVAMLLKNPKEMVQKLPGEIEMLVSKHVNGGLDRYVRSAVEASTAAEG